MATRHGAGRPQVPGPAGARQAKWFSRGTPRNPGADLAQLPFGFNLRGVRLAEGIRAALACAAVLLANEWLGWPSMVYTALAAFLTCLCDGGGPIRYRVPALLAFSLLAPVLWMGFGLLRPSGVLVVVPVACLVLFLLGFARVWGTSAASAGNILSIVVILSLGQALSPPEALEIGAAMLAGGLWATLLTMTVWRLHPYRPARNAVAECWLRLAELAGDLRGLLLAGGAASTEAWDAHGRAHRRAVREEIEYARAIVLDLVRRRGRLSLRGSQAMLRLEACDQIFGSLIALAGLVEESGDATRLRAAEAMLRVLRPALLVLARAMPGDEAPRVAPMRLALRRIEAAAAADPALRPLAQAMTERLRIVARLAMPGGYLPGGQLGGAQAQPWADRIVGPLRANMTRRSATLRHAARVAVISAPALLLTLPFSTQFAYWLPITVVVTLQPFYASTWQRVLERIGGTVLGAMVGAVVAHFVQSPAMLALLLFPLCTMAFAAREVSGTAWIAGITPIVVVLMELIHPGHSSWEIAGLRALFTLGGGMIAIAGSLALWPSWEPQRLESEQRRAIGAHARYAHAVLSRMMGEQGEAVAEAARREAGMTTNNLEASISRALQEPGGAGHPQVAAAAIVDAALRRIAGRLSALWHDPSARQAMTYAEAEPWRDWLDARLGGLARPPGEAPSSPAPDRPEPPPQPVLAEPLTRIARQVELLEGALKRG